jgi:hypothetical protein
MAGFHKKEPGFLYLGGVNPSYSLKIVLSMKYFFPPLLLTLALIVVCVGGLRAQGHFAPSYTPHFDHTFHPMQFNNYYETMSLRHKFRIVFTDGTDTIVSSMIHADTPSYYLLLENKSVKKKDSGRFRRIYPSQTKYIVRLDKYIVSRDKYVDAESNGMASDSCWLFKSIDGKISAYTPLAEDDVEDDLLRYIQKDQGPLVQLTSEHLQEMAQGNEKAVSLAERNKYTKSIKQYNK